MSVELARRLDGILFDALARGESFEAIADEACSQVGLDFGIFHIYESLVYCASGGDQGAVELARDLDALLQSPEVRRRMLNLLITGRGGFLGPDLLAGRFLFCEPLPIDDGADGMAVALYRREEEGARAQALVGALVRLYQYFHIGSEPPSGGRDVLRTRLARLLLLVEDGSLDLGDAMEGAGMDSAGVLPPGYCTLELAFRDRAGQPSLQGVGVELARIFPSAHYISAGGNLLVLLCGVKSRDGTLPEKAARQLEDFALAQGLLIGASVVFGDIGQRVHYKRQAGSALRLGMATASGPGVFYANDRLTDILLSAALDIYGPDMLFLSDIGLLESYDRENNSSYLETLEVYLNAENRVTTASKRLFLDRSTVKYRMKRIEELLEKDLGDINTSKTLRLSIALHRLKQRLDLKPDAPRQSP